MSPERLSAWKTIIAAGALLFLGAAVCSLLTLSSLGDLGHWPHSLRVAFGLAIPFASIATGWPFLVVCGGLIGLHRDSLEEGGIPYPPIGPREAALGGFRKSLRKRVRDGASVALLGLVPGELVEVRSLAEIRSTLDASGTRDGLVFMPEMAAFCGSRMRVFRRVDKLNDWVGHTGLRRVRNTVLLEGVRCNGSGHAGCQASCYIRWNEAWLRRVDSSAAPRPKPKEIEPPDIADLQRHSSRTDETGAPRWVCQSTELSAGTTPLRWGDPRHYLRDLATGNIRLGPLFKGASLAAFNMLQRQRGGVTFPTKELPDRPTSPDVRLGLQPGELVRIRTKREILETLNSQSRNRGLWFDIEMMRYCGATQRVRARVERLIEERTGQLRILTNPCVILDQNGATGEYNGFCAQSETVLWREIWLERVGKPVRPAAPEPMMASEAMR